MNKVNTHVSYSNKQDCVLLNTEFQDFDKLIFYFDFQSFELDLNDCSFYMSKCFQKRPTAGEMILLYTSISQVFTGFCELLKS